MALQIYLRGRNEDGTRASTYKDITSVCGAITLEGEVKAASRKLTFEVVRKKMDYFLDMVGSLERGDGVLVSDTGSPDIHKAVFYGLVWRVTEDDSQVLMNVVCYDNMRFLMTSDCITNVWTDVTAKEVTETVCKELGVTMGKVPDTDVKVNVNARDRSGYEAIMIAWTETRKQTEKLYYPRMVGYKLHVIEKGEMLEGKDLKYQSEPAPCNLISVTKEEDSASAISCIFERDASGTATFKESDKALAHRYGYIVGVNDMGQSTEQGSVKAINEGEKKVEASAIGDWAVQTGWSVRLISNVLTANQLYIERDVHFYDNGIHTMELTLSYENSMDEIENRELEQSAKGAEGGVSGNGIEEQIWNFLRANGFTAEAAAGAMGNMFAESGMIVDVEEFSGGGGYGLCQWTGPRRTSLVSWCQSNGYAYNSLEGQLKFMMHELESRGQLYLRDITNVEEATRKWLNDFEVAGIVRWDVRINAANDYYNRWKNYKKIPTAGQGDGDGIATGRMGWPFANGGGTFMRGFAGTAHLGVDISTRGGTGPGAPVLAVDGGVIASINYWDGRPPGSYGSSPASYGNEININHGNGLYTRYAHLSKISVRVGQKVTKGQIIGTEGNTGESYGTHLHIEVHKGIPNAPRVDPMGYLHRGG